MRICAAVIIAMMLFCGSLHAQVTDGDFSSGTNGWRYVFAPGNNQIPNYGITQIDIDGSGPLGSSPAFFAEVGEDALMNLEQDVYLVGGGTYNFHCNLASIPLGINADGGTTTAFIGPTSIASYWFGPNSTLATRYSSLTANYTPGATGLQTLSIHFNRGYGLGFGNTPINVIDNISLLPVPIPLNIKLTGSNVILSWTNAAFALQTAPEINGTFTNISGASSPCTNAISDSQRFFRLIAN